MSPARKQAKPGQAQDLREIQEHFFRAQEEALKGVVGLVELAGQVLETKSENPACESLVQTLDSLRDFLITLEEAVAGVAPGPGRSRRKTARPGKTKKGPASSPVRSSLAKVQIK